MVQPQFYKMNASLTFDGTGLTCLVFEKNRRNWRHLCSAKMPLAKPEAENYLNPSHMPKPKTNQAETPPYRIFLVEDHPVFRDGLAKLLNAEDNLTVCGEAGDAKTGLKNIRHLKPDLAVVDLGLPGKSGLELIKEIRTARLPVKLLVVSMFDEALYAQRVLRAGGDGYIMKQEDPEEIISAIRDVLAGHIYVSEDVFVKSTLKQSVAEEKSGALDLLTDSELEILELLGLGKSTA